MKNAPLLKTAEWVTLVVGAITYTATVLVFVFMTFQTKTEGAQQKADLKDDLQDVKGMVMELYRDRFHQDWQKR